MSDLAEKLAVPEHTPNTRARARLHQLVARWGGPDKDAINTKKPPELVFVRVLLTKETETWKRVSPFEGKDTLYELVETRAIEAVSA